jgi:FKBP-type peptidyl-prolyl cis-trans isomerase
MEETPTGLWVGISGRGTGEKAQPGMTAAIKYRLSLLDGTICYDSDSLGLKTFRIGHGGVESGLEEGILLLREGDRATFIMPPHLAHGLPGDGNRIPARSIIMYDVELVKLVP